MRTVDKIQNLIKDMFPNVQDMQALSSANAIFFLGGSLGETVSRKKLKEAEEKNKKLVDSIQAFEKSLSAATADPNFCLKLDVAEEEKVAFIKVIDEIRAKAEESIQTVLRFQKPPSRGKDVSVEMSIATTAARVYVDITGVPVDRGNKDKGNNASYVSFLAKLLEIFYPHRKTSELQTLTDNLARKVSTLRLKPKKQRMNKRKPRKAGNCADALFN